MNEVQDEKIHSISASADAELLFEKSETSVLYRLTRIEVDDELNQVAVLGYN
jgi:hypothetical protein